MEVLKDKNNDKKRVQASIDSNLANSVEEILESLGMTTTTLITALFTRVAATQSVPFSLEMTEEEKISLNLRRSLSQIPAKKIDSKEQLLAWLEDE